MSNISPQTFLEGFYLARCYERNNCVLNTVLRKFSSHIKYDASESTDYETDDNLFKVLFRPVFHANGDCRENEGHVSILFYAGAKISQLLRTSTIEFNCTVAVADVTGSKRFMRSLAYFYHPHSFRSLENDELKFGFRDYIRRDILCNDPSELLPGDCLTIQIEVQYHLNFYIVRLPTEVTLSTFKRDREGFYISLDSSFGQELCRVSDYFQRASVTPMIENETRRVYILLEELKYFLKIYLIFRGDEDIRIESMFDIYLLYVVAEKYNIRTIIETCRQFVKSFLCRTNYWKVLKHAKKSIPIILRLAEIYRDESLREIVAGYLEKKTSFESNDYGFEGKVEKKLNADWSCKFEMTGGKDGFKLSRISNDDGQSAFEFYR